jgi:hypothetical protein
MAKKPNIRLCELGSLVEDKIETAESEVDDDVTFQERERERERERESIS